MNREPLAEAVAHLVAQQAMATRVVIEILSQTVILTVDDAEARARLKTNFLRLQEVQEKTLRSALELVEMIKETPAP